MSTEETKAVGDTRGLIHYFWEALARGKRDVVDQVVRQLNPPSCLQLLLRGRRGRGAVCSSRRYVRVGVDGGPGDADDGG